MFDTSLYLDVKGMRVEIEQVREALRRKRRFVALSDGTIAELQEKARLFLNGAPPLATRGPTCSARCATRASSTCASRFWRR